MKNNLNYLTIIGLCLLIFFNCGCIEEKENQNIYCLIYYSPQSVQNLTIDIIIKSNDVELMNKTMFLSPGDDIYRYKSTGFEYEVRVQWNNKTVDYLFYPHGENVLSLTIDEDGFIEFQEITD
jgi:hypothetical protein